MGQAEQAEHSTLESLSQKVTIWYSHADEKFAERLRVHLQPKIQQGIVNLWDASRIQPGDLWEEERVQAIQSAAVAVVLVSADLLACDLIACRELPQILNRAMAKQSVILLLHISPCNYEGTGLERFYPINQTNRPLAKLNRPGRDEVLSDAVRIICQRLGFSL